MRFSFASSDDIHPLKSSCDFANEELSVYRLVSDSPCSVKVIFRRATSLENLDRRKENVAER